MFERFTDRARRATVLSVEEARSLNHNYIGTEHILLGLLAEAEGVAAKALNAEGVKLEEMRSAVEEALGRGNEVPPGHIPYTPRAKKVLELGLREALQLGHNYIGTEHMLLGLIREGEGTGAQVLTNAGIELPAIRKQVIKLLQGYRSVEPTVPPTKLRFKVTHIVDIEPTGDSLDSIVEAVRAVCRGEAVELNVTRIEDA